MSTRCSGRKPVGDAGMAVLAVLVMILGVGSASALLTTSMHQLQLRSGVRHRGAAALAVAEAGVHHALSIVESGTRRGPSDDRHRAAAFSERVRAGSIDGRFTISFEDETDGAVVVTSIGEVGGVRRRVRARVYAAPPALLAAVYGTGFVRLAFEPAVTITLPDAAAGTRPWAHLAAGAGIWLSTPPAPSDERLLPGTGAALVLFSRDAEVVLGEERQPADVDRFLMRGLYRGLAVRRLEPFPRIFEIDRAYYGALAAANLSNAALNAYAGRYPGSGGLARKRDSLYTSQEFARLLAMAPDAATPIRLTGVVYVAGELVLPEDRAVQIVDGALIVEGTVIVGRRARLRVTHAASARRLPGLMVLGGDGLVVENEANLYVHGLLYSNQGLDIDHDSLVEVSGSVVGGGSGISINASGAILAIRYDPAVLGTPGLRVATRERPIAWVATWEEPPW